MTIHSGRRLRAQFSAVIVLMMLLMAMASCKDQTLATVAHDLHKATLAMHDIQGIVIKANKTVPPLIDNPTAVKLMTVCLKIDQATQQSLNLTRNLNSLSAADKASLQATLTPILNAVNDAVKDPAISGIKDINTRNSIQLALATLQTTLNTINALIAAGK